MPGIVIAGTHSGCGKTTTTIGLLAALKKKGLKVQPFKTGPDFIDTGLHRLITGVSSRNLDIWMCGKHAVIECYRKHSENADISVIEGAMGMYDGESGTAMLSSALGLPVLLVVDAYGMAESAGAIVTGFASYRPGADQAAQSACAPGVAGVIFNRVASESHFRRLKDSVRDIPVLGYLPRDVKFEIPHRHLGLVVAEEAPIDQDSINGLADAAANHIDIDQLLEIAKHQSPGVTPGLKHSSGSGEVIKIAIAYDKAFCFYYEDNLDLLRQAGAEIVFSSPLSQSQIPAGADAVYIGGGYPELYAEALSGNSSMLASVNEWAKLGKPLYAECGGLMYLSQGIRDFEGNFFKMAGVLDFETRMRSSKPRLGYREVILEKDCILGKKGNCLRGHEFHYSEISTETRASVLVYSVRDKSGNLLQHEGYQVNKTLASYIHLHFAGNMAIADNFIKYIKEK